MGEGYHPWLEDMMVDGYIDEEASEYFENSWKSYKTLADPGANGKEILGGQHGVRQSGGSIL